MMDIQNGAYTISTDAKRLDVSVIHDYLSRSYWAAEIPLSVVENAIAHSLNFGVYENDRQVGFARIISDYATFAYLADVFVLESYRGRGLSKWLMTVIKQHPQLQGLRRWMLATRDAHGLYEQFGFVRAQNPDRLMEITDPNIYKKPRVTV